MGLVYLDGKSWSQISREERFFCAHLFGLIQTHSIDSFVHYLNSAHQTTLDEKLHWEIGYEVCFYRDLWHHRGRRGSLFSPKRTFDICLFSDTTIMVIEAKAHQEFEMDQLQFFDKDKSQLKEETQVSTVLLAGLASSRYEVPQEVRSHFNGPYLTWNELAINYSNDVILNRADAVYQPGSALTYGKNNASGYMTGSELAASNAVGEEFLVGRSGGLTGPLLTQDIMSGTWKTRKYETNREAIAAINSNWFWLSEFMDTIEKYREP